MIQVAFGTGDYCAVEGPGGMIALDPGNLPGECNEPEWEDIYSWWELPLTDATPFLVILLGGYAFYLRRRKLRSEPISVRNMKF